jgi:biotin transport system substrate-specific component
MVDQAPVQPPASEQEAERVGHQQVSARRRRGGARLGRLSPSFPRPARYAAERPECRDCLVVASQLVRLHLILPFRRRLGSMSPSDTLRRPQPLVLADLLPGTLVRDVALVVGAAGFVGLLAQLSIHLSFTPVPITGQTLGVLLAGAALGWRRAAAAMALYAVAGIAGVPWFAGHASGYVGASFGYIIGFFLAAMLCGYLAERGADRSVLRSVPAMIAAEVIIYAVGVTWLAFYAHLGAGTAISEGLTPFLAGDAIKAAIAAGLLPVAWALAGRRPSARRPAPDQGGPDAAA